MTVLMHDAVAGLGPEAREAYEAGNLSDVQFADDTLILGVKGAHLQEFTSAVVAVGQEFGLELHWGKVQLVSANSDEQLLKPDGTRLAKSPSMIYLGGLIHETGITAMELSRRIGACSSYFRSLSRLWKHANISRAQKFKFFTALVASKLLYGLSTMWLGISEQRKLDGFYCSCLRRIAKIPHAYYSRVSNKSVLQCFGADRLSTTLLRQQLLLLQKVASAPVSSPMRRATFHKETLTPLTNAFVKRVGRPRHTWAEQLLAKGAKMVGSRHRLEQMLANSSQWRQCVKVAAW